MSATVQTQAIGPAPKIARSIHAKLEELFNDKTRRYASGWSDERIAKEINTSPDLVARIRKEAYGELAEDPMVATLKDDIALLRLEFEEAIVKVTKEFIPKMAELEGRITKVTGAHHKAAG